MKNLLTLENIYFRYTYSEIFVLENVSLKINEKDFLFIIGPNGGGKTTLIKIILDLLKPFYGKKTYSSMIKKDSSSIGYVPQIKNSKLDFPITVIDLVLMANIKKYSLFDFSFKKNQKEAIRILDLLGMKEYQKTYISDLSGGQIQRVFLARALMMSPQLLILDEPTAFLDVKGVEILNNILKDLNKKIAIVFVSHDIGVVFKYAKQVACVNKKLYYHESIQDLSHNDINWIYNSSINILNHGEYNHKD